MAHLNNLYYCYFFQELKRIELEQQENLDMTEDDRLFMSLFKSQG